MEILGNYDTKTNQLVLTPKQLNLVIEQFCFGNYDHPPDEDILRCLLQFVTIKDMDGRVVKTKHLSPFEEYAIDSSPVVRSFLLQLCLQCDSNLVK